MIQFIKHRKIFYSISLLAVFVSLFFILSYGLNLGIDFTGGSIMELEFEGEVLSSAEINNRLTDLNIGGIIIQPTNERSVILRMKSIDEDLHQEVLSRLGDVTEHRFEDIGPVIGAELAKKTYVAIALALLSIVLYIAFAFGRVGGPASSWQYSVCALLALFHDIIIPVGIFSVLGKFYGIEFTISIVAALLTILGYSINDTVVVFDRIRENLLKRKFNSFQEVVDQSLNQTLVRSVNTGLTVLLALFAMYFFGGETLRYFSLVLIIGLVAGTYSSIFLASPLLVSWVGWKEKGK